MTVQPAYVRRPGGIVLAVLGLAVTAAAVLVALVIGAAICLYMYYGGHAAIARHVHDAGNWLTGPFHGLVTEWHGKYRLVTNWGIAAAAYLATGILLGTILHASAAPRIVRRPAP